LIALVTAVLLRILTPLPVTTTFAALLFFFVLQFIEERFGTGVRIATSWGKIAVRTTVAFAAFVALRFLLGQVLGVYPVDAHTDWGDYGGFNGIFWGHKAPGSIVNELVILGILGWIMWGYLHKKRMAKLATYALVGIILLGVLFPPWALTWSKTRDEIGKSLAEKGVAATLGAGLTPSSQDPKNYPGYERKIVGAADLGRSVNGPSDITTVKLETGGFHGPVRVDPRINNFEVAHSRNPGDWISVWCGNRTAPNRIHSTNEEFGTNEFRYCYDRAGLTTEFYVQGHGEVTVRTLSYNR
jgi:hypothetical protein